MEFVVYYKLVKFLNNDSNTYILLLLYLYFIVRYTFISMLGNRYTFIIYNSFVYTRGGFQNNTLKDILLFYIFETTPKTNDYSSNFLHF